LGELLEKGETGVVEIIGRIVETILATAGQLSMSRPFGKDVEGGLQLKKGGWNPVSASTWIFNHEAIHADQFIIHPDEFRETLPPVPNKVKRIFKRAEAGETLGEEDEKILLDANRFILTVAETQATEQGAKATLHANAS
jgi:hypothetical protein